MCASRPRTDRLHLEPDAARTRGLDASLVPAVEIAALAAAELALGGARKHSISLIANTVRIGREHVARKLIGSRAYMHLDQLVRQAEPCRG